ncbi:MAG: hypothetical protein GWN93_26950 [Deltaproteobacteria bacterium]|nr:hypothetical protein [Deltaproteobacteria bacterium]
MLRSVEEFRFDTHEYRLHGVVVPGVTDVMKTAGLIDGWFYDEFSLKRGQAVHRATELHDKGVLKSSSIHPVVEPFYRAYTSFLGDTGFRPLIIEAWGIDHVYRFGGMVDRVGLLNGDVALIDIKTGGLPWWTAVQTSAYERLLVNNYFKCNYPEEIIANAKTFKRYGLQLRNNGRYSLTHYSDPENWLDFVAALRLYRHLKRKENNDDNAINSYRDSGEEISGYNEIRG